MSDYVKPSVILDNMIESAVIKSRLPTLDILVRAALAGAYLAFVTSMAFLLAGQTKQFVVGAAFFPAGFAIIVVLGLELLTGNFGVLPTALFAGRLGWGALLRNWSLVFLGNLAGSLIYAGIFWVATTAAGTNSGGIVGDQLRVLAEHKTTTYEALGMLGLLTVFTKAVLANWMVSLGSVMGLASTSTIGKILGSWLPIFIFVSQGWEHCVVNMFAVPVGIMLGAHVTVGEWWLWNQIPATLGNAVGAFIFTGGALFLSYNRTRPSMQDVAAPHDPRGRA